MMSRNPTLQSPVDFSAEVPPRAVGMSPQGVGQIAALFERQVEEQKLHPAAQLVVLRHGQVVLDRAVGVGRGGEVTPETSFLTFSCTKAFTGMCVHRLIEEGKIAWDAPVAAYWPAFGCKGKETATIRHVFLHQAGVPVRGLHRQIPRWPFWPLVTRQVANLAAEYPPGSRTAYHLVNYGFIFGEVIRRVSGMHFEDYLRHTFLQPLGLRRTWLPIARRELRRSPRLFWGAEEQRGIAHLFNLPLIRRAVIPAATLHSTARDLAVFYQMLVNDGQYAGRRYFQAETIEAATTLGFEGMDHLQGEQARWAHGFHLGGKAPASNMPGPIMGKGSTQRTFGHFGNASCMAWADPDAHLVVTFTCNRLLDVYHARARWKALSDAVWDALADA